MFPSAEDPSIPALHFHMSHALQQHQRTRRIPSTTSTIGHEHSIRSPRPPAYRAAHNTRHLAPPALPVDRAYSPQPPAAPTNKHTPLRPPTCRAVCFCFFPGLVRLAILDRAQSRHSRRSWSRFRRGSLGVDGKLSSMGNGRNADGDDCGECGGQVRLLQSRVEHGVEELGGRHDFSCILGLPLAVGEKIDAWER